MTISRYVVFMEVRLERFVKIVYKIGSFGLGIGSFFLAAIMVLIGASIIVRFFGHVILGSFELIEVMIIVTVAFAVAYTAMKQSHVAVTIFVSRLPQRIRAIIASLTWFLSLGILGLILWASADIMLDKWIGEGTDILQVPILPFRFVWVFGLLLFCLALLIEMYRALKQAVSK